MKVFARGSKHDQLFIDEISALDEAGPDVHKAVQDHTPAPVVEAQAEVDKKRERRHHCPHAIRRYRQVPHPRYGAKVPHFTSWLELRAETHRCVDGVLVLANGRSYRLPRATAERTMVMIDGQSFRLPR